jgi:hypothetical protein
MHRWVGEWPKRPKIWDESGMQACRWLEEEEVEQLRDVLDGEPLCREAISAKLIESGVLA